MYNISFLNHLEFYLFQNTFKIALQYLFNFLYSLRQFLPLTLFYTKNVQKTCTFKKLEKLKKLKQNL